MHWPIWYSTDSTARSSITLRINLKFFGMIVNSLWCFLAGKFSPNALCSLDTRFPDILKLALLHGLKSLCICTCPSSNILTSSSFLTYLMPTVLWNSVLEFYLGASPNPPQLIVCVLDIPPLSNAVLSATSVLHTIVGATWGERHWISCPQPGVRHIGDTREEWAKSEDCSFV